PGIKAAAQACLEVAVGSPGIVTLEICGRWLSQIGRKTTNGPVFAIDKYFSTPDETAVGGLAEGDIAVRNIDTRQITILALVDLHSRRISKARAYINTVGVTQTDKGRGTPQVGEFAEVARYVVADALILCPNLVVHASRQIHVLLNRQEIAHLDAIGLGLAVDEAVEHARPVHEWQIVIVELRETAKVSKETPSLHRQIIGQRGGDDGGLFDFEAII